MTDKPIYRMSGAGKCPRALSAERLGYEPKPSPPWLQTAADEGKLHEKWVKDQLASEGYIVSDIQGEVSLDYPQFQLVGHIDGAVYKDSKFYLLEVKSMSHFEFQRWMKGGFLEYPVYADQVSLYYQAMKHNTDISGILYVVKNRSSGYTYRDIMTTPPSDFELVISKLIAIERVVAENKLYEANFDPSSTECKRCGFAKELCIVTEELAPATKAILTKAVNMCREGTALRKQGDEFYKEGKEILENHCKAMSPDKKYTFEHDRMVVPRFHVERISYPRENIENAFSEDIYKPLQKVSSYWQCSPRDLAKDYEENGE